jgi:hypothetical protein
MADPNWFYSTLAQSTAAIVGLAGAFMVQRVFVQRSEIAVEREELRQTLINAFAVLDGQRSAANSVIASLDPYSDDGPVDSRGLSVIGPEGQFPWRVDIDVSVARDPAQRQRLVAMREAVRGYRAALPRTFEDYVRSLQADGLRPPDEHKWLADLPWVESTIPAPETNWTGWLPYSRELVRTQWHAQVADAHRFASMVGAFRSRLVPFSYYVLIVVLALMLIVGVVIPLAYLQAKQGVSKPTLIVAFAILASAFPIYVGLELKRLRGAGDLTKATF